MEESGKSAEVDLLKMKYAGNNCTVRGLACLVCYC